MKKFLVLIFTILIVGSMAYIVYINLPPSGNNTYNYKKHLGTWYYTHYSDPEPSDFKPLTITDKGNNKAEIKWHDGSVEKITFISDDIAHGDTSILEYCSVEVPSGISEQRKNVPVVNVYDFTPINGKESMYVCMRTTDTDRLVVAEWQSAVRTVKGMFSITLKEAQQIAINASGYKYAAYLNDDEEKFYFFLTDSKKYCDTIEDAMERNGYIPDGIEKVIYSVSKTSGKCEEEYSNAS